MFEELFDGSSGDWNTTPVTFGLKEGSTPYHGRAFPVPQVYNDTVRKKGIRHCELGVLKW